MSLSDYKVLFFVPNIIGYFRFLTLAAAMFFHEIWPLCVALYGMSILLDAFDGYYARKLNQCSRFGAFLDMIADRLSTTCLSFILTKFYPDYCLYFMFFTALDIGCHWMLQQYAALLNGADPNGNHKAVRSPFWILNLYYEQKVVMFSSIFLTELFYVLLYVLKFNPQLMEIDLFKVPFYAALGGFAFKHLTNVLTVFHGMICFNNLDMQDKKKN